MPRCCGCARKTRRRSRDESVSPRGRRRIPSRPGRRRRPKPDRGRHRRHVGLPPRNRANDARHKSARLPRRGSLITTPPFAGAMAIRPTPWDGVYTEGVWLLTRNLVPGVSVYGDASKPQTYAGRVGTVDVVYQDVAQRDQDSIFLKNLGMLKRGGTGFLIVKARSADVTAPPTRVFAAAKQALMSSGFSVVDVRSLARFQTDHAAVVVTKP